MTLTKLLDKSMNQGGFPNTRFAGDQQIGFGLPAQDFENDRNFISNPTTGAIFPALAAAI